MKRRTQDQTLTHSHELSAEELAATTGGFLPLVYGAYQAAAVAGPALTWAAMNPHAVVRAGVNGYQAASDAWDWATSD